ncbi:MAG: hypothetical protein WCO60_16770 [Verrucomicrobiota bacterium]
MKRILLLLFILTNTGFAEIVSVRGQGDITYKALMGKPSDTEKAEAQKKAIFDAITRALGNQSEALRQQFNERSDTLLSDELKSFVRNLKADFIPEPKTKKLTSHVTGELDLGALRDLLNQVPKAKTQVALSSAEVAVFFTVRETSENTVSIQNRTLSGSSASNKEVEASQKAGDTGVSTQETVLVQKKENASLSETQKADVQKFRLDGASRDAFGAALQGQFGDKGFKQIVDGAMFESATILDTQFGSGDAVPPAVWKQLTTEVKTAEPSVQYVIVGTLDFSIPTKDPISGMQKVTGTVAGKIYQLGGAGLPRLVAALAPVTNSGVAPTQQDAKKRVLAAMGPMAADEILTKLKNKGAL